MHYVRGDATGLLIPAHGEALRVGCEVFLTQAFRAFGSISATNSVTRVTRLERCVGGSTGEKFFLAVEYARQDPGLHTDLFVKFSRDFNDPARDNRGKFEMESEVRFAAVSRLPGFPIDVPIAYFADYHHESNTGLLVTRQIPFGREGIEPHRPKCMDHEIADPLSRYRAIVTALGRIAAAHRSGRLAPDITARFPYDPETAAAENPITYDATQLHELVGEYADFSERCPELLPDSIVTPAFIAKLDRDVARFLGRESAIKRFLQSDPDLIALCHWNAQIDNAWFWRDSSGALHCGLMDWGRVGQMNVAFALWGCLSGAGLQIWEQHLDELLTLFATELRAAGGPDIPIDELRRHLLLYAGLMFMTYFIASPARILGGLPEGVRMTGPLDPLFRTRELARNNLHLLAVVLTLWQSYDVGLLLEGVPA